MLKLCGLPLWADIFGDHPFLINQQKRLDFLGVFWGHKGTSHLDFSCQHQVWTWTVLWQPGASERNSETFPYLEADISNRPDVSEYSVHLGIVMELTLMDQDVKCHKSFLGCPANFGHAVCQHIVA